MSDTPTYDSLPTRARAFVRAYVQTGVGAKAARAIKAGGAHPECFASRLLARPRIRQAAREYELSLQEDLRAQVCAGILHVRLIRDFDPRQLVSSEGRPLALHELSDEVAAAIQSVEIEEWIDKAGQFVRRYKYKAASKLDADKLILQYQRVLIEKHEHSGPNGQPLQPPAIAITFPVGAPGSSASALPNDGVETS